MAQVVIPSVVAAGVVAIADDDVVVALWGSGHARGGLEA
jgi:hypothetical protein